MWLAEKGGHVHSHPYDLGAYENLISVLGPNVCCWVCPTTRHVVAKEAEEAWFCLWSNKINSVICSTSSKINNMEVIFQFLFSVISEISSRPPYAETLTKSVDMSKLLPTSLVYFNKKRKFQAEQLGMPLPKHMCSYQSSAECNSSHTGTAAKESSACMIIVENAARGQEDDSELESENGSNSFCEDADSVTSHEAKLDPGCLKACSSDHPSTSSINLGGNWSKNALYSLESRSVTKLMPDKLEQSPTGRGWGTPHHGSGCHPSMDYEEHFLGLGNHEGCTCAECRTEGVELTTEKELENLLNANVNPSNYVLSSGRWTVNQGNLASTFSFPLLSHESCEADRDS
uniref:S-acyltransferase n=1 Tax=Solanum tuberosum TaxID=4113 RepID=M1BNI2_SOLTU